jgi:hypothetical protein
MFFSHARPASIGRRHFSAAALAGLRRMRRKKNSRAARPGQDRGERSGAPRAFRPKNVHQPFVFFRGQGARSLDQQGPRGRMSQAAAGPARPGAGPGRPDRRRALIWRRAAARQGPQAGTRRVAEGWFPGSLSERRTQARGAKTGMDGSPRRTQLAAKGLSLPRWTRRPTRLLCGLRRCAVCRRDPAQASNTGPASLAGPDRPGPLGTGRRTPGNEPPGLGRLQVEAASARSVPGAKAREGGAARPRRGGPPDARKVRGPDPAHVHPQPHGGTAAWAARNRSRGRRRSRMPFATDPRSRPGME